MKKRIRWAEFLIEKGIAAISFASLGAIVLIFLFVFREAAPILTMDGKTLSGGHGETSRSTESHTESGDVGSAESYGDPAPVGAAESYGDPAPVGASETYGDPAPVGAAETYGDPEPDTTAAGATASSSDSSTGSVNTLASPGRQ